MNQCIAHVSHLSSGSTLLAVWQWQEPGRALRQGSIYPFILLPQNCGLPSILDGPGPFTVFAPSNEAVDSLRDGRLIYLFTSVSSMGRWGCGLGLPELPQPPPTSSNQLFPSGPFQASGASTIPHLQPWPGERVSSFMVFPVSGTTAGFDLSGDPGSSYSLLHF